MVKWLENAIFYQIFPASFYDSNGDGIGDLQGIIQKLDYVRDSGFNAIWFNPWFKSAFRDAGYDVTDYFDVAERYGTLEDARQLFAEAHRRGIHVIIDLVIGHTALEHPWFKQSCSLSRNEFSDLYIWSPQVSFRGDGKEDYYVSGWSPRGSYKANFFAVQPALNYGYNVVRYPWEMPYDHPACRANRQRIIDIMEFWLKLGCDGFRVDMAASIIKRDPESKLTSMFWRSVRAYFDQHHPQAALISEWFLPQRAIAAGFHLDFFNQLIFHNDNWLMTCEEGKIVFDEHDHGSLKRWLMRYKKAYDATSKNGYIGLFSGNHDKFRLTISSSPESVLVKMALLMTMPGCPFVYYGDEIGMRQVEGASTEGSDRRGGARTPMQWKRCANAGFSTAPAEKLYLPIDPQPDYPTVEDALAGKNLIYAGVRRLIQLRLRFKALQSGGGFEIVHGMSGRFPLVFIRSHGRERVLVAFNPTGETVSCALQESWVETLDTVHAEVGRKRLVLERNGYAILRL